MTFTHIKLISIELQDHFPNFYDANFHLTLALYTITLICTYLFKVFGYNHLIVSTLNNNVNVIIQCLPLLMLNQHTYLKYSLAVRYYESQLVVQRFSRLCALPR